MNAELDSQIDVSLNRAVAFLKSAQLPHGEFAALVATHPDLHDGVLESSPFFTTFVLYALHHVDDAVVGTMIDKAARFLDEQKQIGGLWRYYSSRQYRHYRVPPDLDDTACATFALKQAGRRKPRNEWLFRLSRDGSGRFLTYFLPNGSYRMSIVLALGQFQARFYKKMSSHSFSAADEEQHRSDVDPVPSDDVDPIVNANAILLLGEREITKAAIEFLISVVRHTPNEKFSLYYEDTLVLSYKVARAFRHSAPSLGVLRDAILSDLDARAKSGQLFRSALSCGMAASILITFKNSGSLLDALIDALLRLQGEDGSWKEEAFYTGIPGYWWGSRELTTAFCLEAVARCRDIDRTNWDGPALVAPALAWNPDGVLTAAEGVDEQWYSASYPHTVSYTSAAEHYAHLGWREGKDPNPGFSTTAYLRANPDVAAAQINPLVHYLREGRAEGRALTPVETTRKPDDVLTGPNGVDAKWYVTHYPEAAGYISAAEHYARVGWREGRDPNPNFFTIGYLRANPDIVAAGINPLVHYLTRGRQEGRTTVEPEAVWNPDGVLTGAGGVDAEWYLAQYPEAAGSVSPAAHYAYVGWREGKDPNPSFSTIGYLAAYPDIAAAQINPFVHYLAHGRQEGRTYAASGLNVIRAKNWWPGKITPVLAVSFATALLLGIPVFPAIPILVVMVVGLAACATYVSLINDLTDAKQDALAGQPNATKGRSPVLLGTLLAGSVAVGACCAFVWFPDYLSIALYLACWLAFSAYSLRPIRLKERALLGAIADASGAHVFPTLLAASLIFHSQGLTLDPLWTGLLAAWSSCYGLRSIIAHQFVDEPNDARSHVNTYVRTAGIFRAVFISDCLLRPIELLSLALIIMRLDSAIVLCSAVTYGMIIYAKHQFQKPEGYYHSFLSVSLYYILVLPWVLLAASSVLNPVDLLSWALFVLVFYGDLGAGTLQAYLQVKQVLFPDHPTVRLSSPP